MFQEQRFGYDSTDGLESLAIKRQNGITEIVEGLKAHFRGRVTTSPLSNTLIIQNIQYNDSLYQFSSILSAQCVPIPRLVSKTLMPRFFLDVTGKVHPLITLLLGMFFYFYLCATVFGSAVFSIWYLVNSVGMMTYSFMDVRLITLSLIPFLTKIPDVFEEQECVFQF